ncbi:MAG: iron-containing alcohol dehydrogenase [Clostridiaceae bacterium]|jgi:alcohol dehydrogenase class IV|nr:iron-containing alcohol dehydrogenase [Clostridiaceae bacterium]
MIKNFDYFVPVKVIFGAGRLEDTGTYVKEYGKKALIVTTGPFFKETGLVDRLMKILAKSGVESAHYYDISPNPLSTQVDAGAQFGREFGCDVLIGLGGGSAIDAAKGIAVAIGHNAPIWDYCPSGDPGDLTATSKTLPIIAITTTSGTGSHITPYAVITNPETKEKPGLGSDYTFPKVAIVDPELMLSVPPKITAATGFDILAHSIEAYTSEKSSPITDKMCEEAIRIVGRYLRRAVENGGDLEARTALAYADTLAGFSIAVAVITLCHSISHAVGGVCETVHGETLAAMTPHTMRYSMKFCPEKYKNIGLFLRDECCCEETDDDCSLEASVKEVEKLINDIGMNIPLSKQGVKESDFEEIANGTIKYMAGGLDNDLRKASKDDIIDILKKSF